MGITNHDGLKDAIELAYVLSGLCQIAEECGRCPLIDDCANDYKSKGSYASLDECERWLKMNRRKKNDES